MTAASNLSRLLDQVRGKACWHVNAGGAAGSTFSLAFGAKVPREAALTNPAVSEDFRDFQGEVGLYVWCSWRLEDDQVAIASSYEEDIRATTLKSLTGQTLRDVHLEPRSLDLRLEFDRCRLILFCDHVLPSSEYECNWELNVGNETLIAGPGSSWRLEGKEALPP
jgi:hypothetical protein